MNEEDWFPSSNINVPRNTHQAEIHLINKQHLFQSGTHLTFTQLQISPAEILFAQMLMQNVPLKKRALYCIKLNNTAASTSFLEQEQALKYCCHVKYDQNKGQAEQNATNKPTQSGQ